MRFAILLALLAGCGAVSLEGADAGDAGKRDLDLDGSRDAALEAPRDAGAECAPTTLICSGLPGACPQGQAQGSRRTCGGAPVAVCCPVNDCDLALCDVCPLCVP